MSWRTLKSVPNIRKAERLFATDREKALGLIPMFEGEENIRRGIHGDIEAKTKMKSIPSGRVSNTEYALMQAHWPKMGGVDHLGNKYRILAKNLADVPGVDRINTGDFNKILRTFSRDRFSNFMSGTGEYTRDMKDYYLRKYPMIREAVDPRYASAKEKAQKYPGLARRIMNRYWR